MEFFNQLVLAGAVLLLLAILASALSYRIGMPLLLVFLAVEIGRASCRVRLYI